MDHILHGVPLCVQQRLAHAHGNRILIQKKDRCHNAEHQQHDFGS